MSKRRVCLSFRVIAVSLSLILTGAAAVAQTGSYTVIANMGIHPNEGSLPESVVFDHAGNLFGIAGAGGTHEAGTVFELIPKTDGYWTEKTIANFRLGAAITPLVVDAEGNLYGANNYVSGNEFPSVFELSPSNDGSWTKTKIYEFQGPNGENLSSGLVIDKNGNLYGATTSGGLYNGGTVYELLHQKDGSWNAVTLYNMPYRAYTTGLAIDSAGNLYGSTEDHTTSRYCASFVFSLAQPKSEGENWGYTTLHTFPGFDLATNPKGIGDAGCPSRVISDAKGDLYGTSGLGGKYGYGTVFEIPAGGGADGPDKLLYSFDKRNFGGYNPSGPLVLDGSGNLYGVASTGGPYSISIEPGMNAGKIFEMLPQTDGSWSIRTLYNFGGRTYKGEANADGFTPSNGLVVGPDGNLYGTTEGGGYHPVPMDFGYNGTVFKFVVH